MGTRGLVAFKWDGEPKRGTYNHFDSYPSGLGLMVVQFIQNYLPTEADWDNLKKNVEQSPLDFEKERFNTEVLLTKLISHPEGFEEYLSFAGNSLFCEWGYMFDFDDYCLRVFKGFNETKLHPKQLFSYLPTNTTPDGSYYPIKEVMSIELEDILKIPRKGGKFVAQLEK